MSDTECPLPKRSQLRAARSENGDDSQENPITAAIPVGEETVAPPPPPAARKTVEEPPASASSSETEPDADEEAPASSSSKRRRNVHPVGYALRALLVLGLAGTTIAVPMTGRVGSDSSLTVPARAFGASVGGPSWAVSSALPQATALDGTLTANSRAKAQAPVSITGCASGNGKGQIFVHGKVVETVPEDQVVETLIKHAEAMAEQMRAELGEEALEGTAPSVLV